MRKLLLALFFCLAGSVAQAQNITCPNRPDNDSSNACANTRFVQSLPITPGKIPLTPGSTFPVPPESYGAVQGSSDSTTAIQSWLNSGLPLACNGTYTLTGVVTATVSNGSTGISLKGTGGNCKFILNPPSNVYSAFGASVTVVSPGSGYIVNDELPCSGGTLASPTGAACTIHVKTLTNQASAHAVLTGSNVTSIPIDAGGSNYSTTKPPSVLMTGGTCTRIPKGTAVVSAGAVSSITIIDAGVCTVVPSIIIDPPSSGPIATAEIWDGGAYSVAPGAGFSHGTSKRGSSGSGATFTVTFSSNQPAPAGIVINGPTPDHGQTTPNIVLHDFTIAPAKQIGSWPALRVAYSGTTGATAPLVDLQNVNVLPTSASAASLACWDFSNAAVSNFKDSTCQSSETYATAPGFKGLKYVGIGISTTTANFKNINVFGADECVYISGTVVQGLIFDGLAVITCNNSVHIAPSDNDFIMAAFSKVNTNALQTSFLLENAPNVFISDSLLNQQQTPRYGGVSACVQATGRVGQAIHSFFHDNICSTWQAHQASAATLTIGFKLDNVYGSADNQGIMVRGNVITGAYYGLAASNTTALQTADNHCMTAYGPTYVCEFWQSNSTGYAGPVYNVGSIEDRYNASFTTTTTFAPTGVDLMKSTGTPWAIRLPNSTGISARNVANSADLSVLSVDTNDVLVLGANTTYTALSSSLLPAASQTIGDSTHRFGGVWTTTVDASSTVHASSFRSDAGLMCFVGTSSCTSANATLNADGTSTTVNAATGGTVNLAVNNSTLMQVGASGVLSSTLIRLPNNTALKARNAANSGDNSLVYSDTSNNTVIGGTGSNISASSLHPVGAGAQTLGTSTNYWSNVYATTYYVGSGSVKFAENNASYTILNDMGGLQSILLGTAANIYRQTTHYFQAQTGSSTFLTLDSTGATFGNGLKAASLPTTGGTIKGTLCVDTTGVIYVKTTAGACL